MLPSASLDEYHPSGSTGAAAGAAAAAGVAEAGPASLAVLLLPVDDVAAAGLSRVARLRRAALSSSS